MLILQFFRGFVVSLLASIGVLQTPGPDGLAFRRHLTVSPVTRNRRLSDACMRDGIATSSLWIAIYNPLYKD